MKVAVFGATGQTGRHVVDVALERGHDVTAFGRSVERIENDHAALALFKGDVFDRRLYEIEKRPLCTGPT